MVDFAIVPIIAMSTESRFLISTRLNPPKVLQTCDKLFRDWRGLAGLLGMDGEVVPAIASSSDPTGSIINFLKNRKVKVSLEDFLKALERMDRWDVIDDAMEMLERDGRDYMDRLEKGDARGIDNSVEKQVLTVDDLYRCDAGLPTQNYDAFLLYADEDTAFVTELIDNLEKKSNLRLCIKDRDLIGSATFEHDAIMQLIAERCNRLIVVLSPSFVKGPLNEFFINYAQVTGIYRQQRKIVPVLYQKCEIPRQLCHTFILDYNRNGICDFWGRLRDSVRSVKNSATSLEEKNNRILQKSTQIVEKSLEVEEVSAAPRKSVDTDSLNPTLNANGLKKNKFFTFSTKRAAKSDGKVDLPSLEGLDDLEDGKSEEAKTKENKRSLKSYKKKIKAFVTRS